MLREEPAKRRIAVLGEMLELGGMSEALHREIGHYVAKAGVDVLVGVRGASRSMVEEAQKAGLQHHAAFFFEEPESAGDFLREFRPAGRRDPVQGVARHACRKSTRQNGSIGDALLAAVSSSP